MEREDLWEGNDLLYALLGSGLCNDFQFVVLVYLYICYRFQVYT